MGTFFKYCLSFILLLIAISITLEYLLRQLPNPYKYKYEWMQANAVNVEILILGNSHTFYGIHPDVFSEKGFNLANPSQMPLQDLALLTYWSKKYQNLKTVVYPISYFTWFGEISDLGAASYRCRYYSIYMDLDLFSHLSPFYHFELAEPISARIKIREMFLGSTCNPDWSCDKYGSSSFNKYSEELFNQGGDNVLIGHAETWDHVEKNYAIMKDIAEFCKKRNVQLILVTTPCWHTYYDKLNNVQLSKMYEITRRFQKEYNLPYFNYLKDSRFCKEDFYNSSHLSDVGAIKLTRILADDIISIAKDDDVNDD